MLDVASCDHIHDKRMFNSLEGSRNWDQYANLNTDIVGVHVRIRGL